MPGACRAVVIDARKGNGKKLRNAMQEVTAQGLRAKEIILRLRALEKGLARDKRCGPDMAFP